MNNKTVLILMAILGIGLFALPQTMSLFAGQHSFVNLDATGNQIECTKCHGDIQAEITSTGASPVTGTNSPHASFKCEYCHRIEAGSASGDNAYATVTYKNGTAMRTIAMTVENFESENYPGSVKHPGEGIVNNAPNLTLAAPGFVFIGGAAISPIVVGQEGNSAVLPIYAEKLLPTYNKATGMPYDTSVNKDAGLTLSKIPMDNTGWTSGSRGWVPTLLNAGSRAVNPGTEYHAASLVSCLECHGGAEPYGHYSRVMDGTQSASCEVCHYGASQKWTPLAAGGFGLTGGEDTGAKEAHKVFQMTNDTMSRQKDGASNGACIACHTHVNVDISYTRPTTYQFDAVTFSDGSTVVGGFATGGSTVTYSGN